MQLKLLLPFSFVIPLFSAYAVVNGEDAQPEEFPWIAKIVHSVDSNLPTELSIINGCGGTLIGKDLVLTAAHCIDDKKDNLDGFKISFPNSYNTETYSVSEVYVHPSYKSPFTKLYQTTSLDEDGEESQTFNLQAYTIHDIGLIKLQRNVTDITPISIGKANPDTNKAYGAGFGVRGYPVPKEDKNTLKKIELNLLDSEACYFHASFADTEITSEDKKSVGVYPLASSANAHCVVGTRDFSSLCHGDSGSPLIQVKDNKSYVVGVLSSGASVSCAHETSYPTAPALYTSAIQYKYFINSIILGDTNLDKHKNIINNPYNDKNNGEGWTLNDKSRFYLSDIEFGEWEFINKYLATLAFNQLIEKGSVPEEFKELIEKYPDGNLLRANNKEVPKLPTFFGTSYLPAKRHQIVDLVTKTGLSMEKLAQIKPHIIVSEMFTRTYCGGDRYFLNAILLDGKEFESITQIAPPYDNPKFI